MNKKIVAIMMAMIMVLSLVECGGEATSASTEKEVNSTVSTKESVETNAIANVSADKSENTDVNASQNTKVVTTETTQELDINNIVGQTLGEYASALKKTPRYFLANYQDGCMDEVTELSLDALLQQKAIFVYVGENKIPCLGDKMLVIQIDFDDSIREMTFEDVINTINGYKIAGVMDLPENLAANNSQQITFANRFELEKAVAELFDLTEYEAILGELEATKDDARELKDILPFEIYSVEPGYGLCNLGNMDGTSKTVLAGSIPGELDSVMVVKMDDASTYAILLRFPYEANESGNYCSYKDLGNFRVIATDLKKEDVEMMVSTEEKLNEGYDYLIQDFGGTTFGDSVIRAGQSSVKYLVFDPYNGTCHELTEENKHFIVESGRVFAYSGTNAMPDAYEDVVVLTPSFDKDINEMSLEEVIEVLEDSQILARQMYGDITGNY